MKMANTMNPIEIYAITKSSFDPHPSLPFAPPNNNANDVK